MKYTTHIFLLLAFRYAHGLNIHMNNNLMKKNDMVETRPLTDLYKGMDAHTIKDIYFSDDLKRVFYLDIESGYNIVNSNPVLTNAIVERATNQKISAAIIQEPKTFYDQSLSFANGVFEFAIMSAAFTIVLNVIRLFIINKNPMMQSPFTILQMDEDKEVDKSTINITFADWAGSPEVVDECFEIVSFIQNSSAYDAAGAEIPKGILLEGPPGTGKTLLAKAIAGETNATFLSMSGSEFVEMFVGLGALKVRGLFEQARENSPAIIFIDEIDAIGKKRGGPNMMASNDEREQTLNQILTEMDGFEPNTGVIVIAATNRKEVLDEALLRPGRFDRIVYVPLPDRASRESMLRLYLKNKNTADDIDIKYLADNTNGFSGAEIKNLLNEAAIYAARRGDTVITKKYIEDAFEKVIVGITKRVDTRSNSVRRRVAIHEIGHALLAAHFNTFFELEKVSMKSTYNGIGGYTQFNEYSDIRESGLYTRELLINRIIVSLGGKAAETIEYGENNISVGASEDLKQANKIAREMIEQYGMGWKLEVFSYDREVSYSDNTLERMDKEIMDIVQYCYNESKTILTDKTHHVNVLTEMLLNDNVLDGKTVTDIINNRY